MTHPKPTELEERIAAMAKIYSVEVRPLQPGQYGYSAPSDFTAGYLVALQDPLVIALRDALYMLTTVAIHDGRPYQKQIKLAQDAILDFDQALASLKGER